MLTCEYWNSYHRFILIAVKNCFTFSVVFSFFFLGTGAGSGGSGGRIFKRGSSGGECRFDRVTFTPGSGGGGRSTPTARLLSGTGT